jgi:hypothetical protein
MCNPEASEESRDRIRLARSSDSQTSGPQASTPIAGTSCGTERLGRLPGSDAETTADGTASRSVPERLVRRVARLG